MPAPAPSLPPSAPSSTPSSDVPNPSARAAAGTEAGAATPVRERRDGDPSPGESASKAPRVRAMFDAIAPRYDLLNRLLTGGVDRLWRAEVVREAVARRPRRVLDAATGTADLAIAIKRAVPAAEVIGCDFAEAMLERGRAKARRRGVEVRLDAADALELPYPDASFDLVTIAYGLRNFADYEAGLREFRRVLRPGGALLVLEFTPPRRGPIGRAMRFYTLTVVPWLGGRLSGRPGAYRYLNESVMAFLGPAELAARMYRAGFAAVRYRIQSFGISALHVATLAEAPSTRPVRPTPSVGGPS